ncbi:MAG: N-acetylgalactosamine system component [Gemmatimonadales bacterium]|jgi:mannose/fructose-specific phosphotransferase system component IIA|nr:N-acetylgalactosamine system component [Gemmatimonadales bacterium]
MSEELRGVVVCHGPMAEALVQAAEQISGVDAALIPVSNMGCDRDTLEQRVLAAVDQHPAVIFVDMASGSCLIAVLKRLRADPSVRVVTGVNLAMLVDFVFHRSLSPEEAASRAVTIGQASIRLP